MKKLIIIPIIVTVLVIVTVLAVAFNPEVRQNSSDEKRFIWTKAVCNEQNYCIDLEITCQVDKVVSIKPVPEAVYFSNDWIDPRPEDYKNKYC